ncbi:MAG: flavodoxin-dependent (E)-4-hydroxy-3-methylbut-2-enyl-diphosphate synthase [Planctomycetota bacterium]|nr:flavodoxin-dependent (E)-4-hydroxy-3-methylbut-2-enyl-diphosphate synthase [Planctomycetota bacterium]
MTHCSGIKRRLTRQVAIGPVKVGGGAPISVQSMIKARPEDRRETARQIRDLEAVGCDIVRIAVPNMDAVRTLAAVRKKARIPLEADIHFSPQLALASIAAGADAIRLNPGNMSDQVRIAEICRRCRARRIPIRVGMNSGSAVPRKGGVPVKRARNADTAAMMVRQALAFCKMLENCGFHAIMMSLKAADVLSTVRAYRMAAERCDYPFHLGVTATGIPPDAVVKSALGIGSLLLAGIGDTIRVSLTAPPIDEIKVARSILRAVGVRVPGVEVLACPTCGRTEFDVAGVAREVENRLRGVKRPVRVAVMGCIVNGPGEAAECDVGVAGGKGESVLFKKGKVVKRLRPDAIVNTLVREVRILCGDD